MNNKYSLKKDPYSSHYRISDIVKKQVVSGKILDIGCGPGFLGTMINNKNYLIYGIDKNKDVLNLASKNYFKLFCLDIESDNFILQTKFKIILFGDILEHLDNPQKVLHAYSHLYLEKDGKVIISLPNIAHWSIRLNLAVGKFNYGKRGIVDSTHLRFFTYKTMKKLIYDSGLLIDNYYYTPVPLPLLISSTNIDKPLFFIHKLNYFITGLWKKLFAYQFIFLCSLK